jgi:hypothetical protein
MIQFLVFLPSLFPYDDPPVLTSFFSACFFGMYTVIWSTLVNHASIRLHARIKINMAPIPDFVQTWQKLTDYIDGIKHAEPIADSDEIEKLSVCGVLPRRLYWDIVKIDHGVSSPVLKTPIKQ